MRRRVSIGFGVLAAVLLAVSAAAAGVQKEEKAKTSPDRVEGNIQMMDKSARTLSVTVKGKTMQRQVVYDDKTKFTFRNKPATIDELKEGRRVIVLGKLNDKAQLMATRIDVRDEK
jgi:cytochrome c-type biogenesis protein CcmE